MSKSSQNKHLVKTPNNVRIDTAYSDADFQMDAHNFHKEVVEHLMDNGYLKSPEYFTHCSRAVLESTCTEAIVDKYDMLLKHYNVKDGEFWAFFYLQRTPFPVSMDASATGDSPIVIDLTEQSNYLTVNVYPYATEADWAKQWSAIKDLLKRKQGYVERLRGPDNPKLLYAITKARNTNIKWGELADLINSNSLEGYVRQKGDKKSWDEATLKSYYHINKKYVVVK